jgi:hypothetical protein
MHCRFGILYLGQVHARTKLERRRYTKGRARTDYARAVRVGAPSDLHRASDNVRRNRDRARACRGIVALPLVFVSIWIKLRHEEKLMLKKFPDQYATYQHRVKRLIPFVL